MYQPVNGSREAVCSGGHIGPPLREAGRCSGANGNWCKTGALRGGTEPAPYRGTGAGRRWDAPGVWLPPAKFRNEILGASQGHPALRRTGVRAAGSSAPTGGCGRFYQPPWDGLPRRSRFAARRIAGSVIGVSSGMGTFVPHPPSPGYSKKGAAAPFLVSGARAGKKLDHFSPRRVRGEKYFSGRKCGKWPPQWGGHFLRAVGLLFHSAKTAKLSLARKVSFGVTTPNEIIFLP